MTQPVTAPIAQGMYRSASDYQNLVFSAGMTPRENGVLKYKGVIAVGLGLDEAKAAARIAAKNAVDAIEATLDGGHIRKVVQTAVYLVCAEGFEHHSRIADAASEYVQERLGEQALGARTAIAVASLPGGAPVEIQMTAEVERR